MKTNKMFLGCMGILAMSMTLLSCSSDNDTPNTDQTGYQWSKDGGYNACDHLLFTADGKEASKGTVIGNGDQHFVFKGTQTLERGLYTR